MSLEQVTNINETKFSVEIDGTGESPGILFKGTIDLADPGIVLTPFFMNLHNAVINEGVKNLVFDICGLDYINSSGIKAVIKYVLTIVSSKPDIQYNVIIEYDKDKRWQPLSFKPVTLLAPKIVSLKDK